MNWLEFIGSVYLGYVIGVLFTVIFGILLLSRMKEKGNE